MQHISKYKGVKSAQSKCLVSTASRVSQWRCWYSNKDSGIHRLQEVMIPSQCSLFFSIERNFRKESVQLSVLLIHSMSPLDILGEIQQMRVARRNAEFFIPNEAWLEPKGFLFFILKCHSSSCFASTLQGLQDNLIQGPVPSLSLLKSRRFCRAKENKTLLTTFAQWFLNLNLKRRGRRGKVRKQVICIIVVLWMGTPRSTARFNYFFHLALVHS